MLVAKNEFNQECFAWNTSKSEGSFFCRDCNEQVVLKKGKIREHHFAHKAYSKCSSNVGESNIHYKCKRELYTALTKQENCSSCFMELKVGPLRPDICLRINGRPVVIEVQRSSIDIDVIIKRTRYYSNYKRENIFVLWILPNESVLKTRFSKKHNKKLTYPKSWQLFLHQMYFGRIYIWSHNSFVKPLHLSKFEFYVEEGNWVEESPEEFHNTNWYNNQVGYANYGGYKKTSKTQYLSIPPINKENQLMDISKDFHFEGRSELVQKNWDVPSANLLIDRQSKWW